jgi:hypothetical protein
MSNLDKPKDNPTVLKRLDNLPSLNISRLEECINNATPEQVGECC